MSRRSTVAIYRREYLQLPTSSFTCCNPAGGRMYSVQHPSEALTWTPYDSVESSTSLDPRDTAEYFEKLTASG